MTPVMRGIIGLAGGVLGCVAATSVRYSMTARMPSVGEYVTLVSAGLIDRGFFAPDLKVAGAEATTQGAVDSLVATSPDLSRQEAFFNLVRRNGIRIGFRRLLWPGVLGFAAGLALGVATVTWWTRRQHGLTPA